MPGSAQGAVPLRKSPPECDRLHLRKIFIWSSHPDTAVKRLTPECGEHHVMATRRQQRKIWSGILDLLRFQTPAAQPPPQVRRCVRAVARSRNTDRQSGEATRRRNHLVAVLDRVARDIIIVSWRDPQRCCYAEQTWRLRQAPHHGTCALSGRTIVTGSLVFMPSSRPRPGNADEMILPAALSPDGRLLNGTTRPAFAVHDDDT
ncbi:DUF3331 domain-containing protein [Paraburkholderia aromaticivorans]|uniref:DUF3331 domain-containing protein n=1 Tax=Paraburkholderia aromaticivorans TaxID=2026199 RepID=UPI003D674387